MRMSPIKSATTVISLDKGDMWGILSIKGHSNTLEAKAYAFDEICRMIDDIAIDNKVTVESFKDTYGELCMSVTAKFDEDDEDAVNTILIKNLAEEDDR